MTCALGVEAVLADELHALGVSNVRPARSGVGFSGPLRTAYAVCLWSRTGSRVLMPLAQAPATSADDLYEGVRAVPWEQHLSATGTLAVDFGTDPNPAFRNTMFGAQKTKDAIVDRLRDRFGERPSVDPVAPDVRVNVRVRSSKATVSLDLSGDALHRRGYRDPGVQGPAPLKESLAAAMLLLAGWRGQAEAGALVDPLCGSATLLIEGAWIAGDVAPGLLRSRWGFSGWLGHDDEVWGALLEEADERAERGLATLPPIVGSDRDAAAVSLATANVARAGLRGRVVLCTRDVSGLTPPATLPGLVATNPPYGERLGDAASARAVYATLGARLRTAFDGWRYAVLAGDDSHATALGLTPQSTFRLHNGTIPVRLDVGTVAEASFAPRSPDRRGESRERDGDETGGDHALSNRLRKNVRRVGRWAKREGVTCWRAYDADLPDYAVAIDVYDCADGLRRLVVSEYEAPSEIETADAARRLDEASAAAAQVLGADPGEVRVKVRRRQRHLAQYEKLGETGRFHEVREGGARLLVNLDDYLDTGLFLDHRITRGMVADLARGGRLLNLFCYTGAATVRAALGGAVESTSVDMSNTYVDWARRNLRLNGMDLDQHCVVRDNVLTWLSSREQACYDVVFLDPPSFSSSKAMVSTFDVQRDHAGLLADAAAVLADEGTIVFSTNLRRFRLDEGAMERAGLAWEDVTAGTIPPDFSRSPRIHRCLLVRRA